MIRIEGFQSAATWTGMTFALGLAMGWLGAPATMGNGSAPADRLEPPPAMAAEAMRSPIAHRVEVLRVVDGDTFEARVPLWPGLEITTKVRLRGIDTPELKARCGEERIKAEAARDALKAILDQGDVGIFNIAHDKYAGRVLAQASTQATRDVSAALLGAGVARRYAGGRRESWCS